MKLQSGDPAPDFTLPDQNGKLHSLAANRGTWTIVYFYPKDDTPGCTAEACGFRDSWAKFTREKIQVWGISADTVAKHAKFAQKYELPFPLLADEDKEVVKKYGVWGKKKFMGREFMGINRVTFLIDPKGQIAKVYEKVKPADHAEEILADRKKLR
jgi:peroxiredoxin Q/BCP